MAFQAITMSVVTHPLQVLLVGMIVLHGLRMTLSAVRQRPVGYLDHQAAA